MVSGPFFLPAWNPRTTRGSGHRCCRWARIGLWLINNRQVAHKSLTDSILDSTRLAAEQTLLEQRPFMVSGSQYQPLMDLLDRPEQTHAGGAGQAGIRAMLTHPIDEAAARFYTQFGFISSPLRQQQLLLLLKDARRWVR